MSGRARLIRRIGLGVLITVVLVAAGFAVVHLLRSPEPTPPTAPVYVPDPPTPDPRVTTDTPFRNVRPGVKYVGDATCNGCHTRICKSYHAHPMGRSAEFIPQATPLEKYPPPGQVAATVGPFDLNVEKTADGMTHRLKLHDPSPAPVAELVIPVQVAIGSGTRGRSYLSNDGGFLWQTPVSWFGPEQKWDVSPGYRLSTTTRRAILPACLYCHVDDVEPVASTVNRYREPLFPRQASVGCERCHGPGELHVAERAKTATVDTPDTSIVNPKHLSPALQLAVCEQCHLQGQERVNRRGRDLFEFRPGLLFEEFVSVYVKHPDIAQANKSVGQFEQMEQSKCFTKSGGRLVCTSCHDPHVSPTPTDRDAHYRQQCQKCHQASGEKPCSLPLPGRQVKQDSCIACHMPKASSSNIAHASVTDHRVPRTNTPPPLPRGLAFGTPPLVRFRSGTKIPADELDRDLGIALARFGQTKLPKDAAAQGAVRPVAIEKLKGSLAKWPGDAEAWAALTVVQTDPGKEAERLKAASAAAELTGNSEAALMALAEAAIAAEQYDLAIETAGKWAKLNPRSDEPLSLRAFAHLRRGEWAEAEADCRSALKINPLHAETRLYLGVCLYKLGQPAAGLREARTAALVESDPREQARLIDRYQRATR